MADILQRIYAAKGRQAAGDEVREPYAAMRARAFDRRDERRSFADAIREAAGPAIIGEIKRASPSAGLIARNFEPAEIARDYDRAGVDAVSVLTESDHFLGELGYLDIARAHTSRPLLRKDFLRTPYDVAQSAAYGADAILLIVAGVSDGELAACAAEAAQYDLDVLVEVHDAAELRRALDLGVTMVGINNRNLRTFETDLTVSEELLPALPSDIVAIAESGMRGRDDIVRLYQAGARGFLIGEALMQSGDRSRLVAELKTAVPTAITR